MHANGSVNWVIFRKLQSHVPFGRALRCWGFVLQVNWRVCTRYRPRPLTASKSGDRPGVPAESQGPPLGMRSGGHPQREGGTLPVRSGSCPGPAQPTCSLLGHSQDPFPAEKCEGGAGPWRLGGPREGVIYSRLPVGKHRTVSSASAGGERCLARPCLLSRPPASS